MKKTKVREVVCSNPTRDLVFGVQNTEIVIVIYLYHNHTQLNTQWQTIEDTQRLESPVFQLVSCPTALTVTTLLIDFLPRVISGGSESQFDLRTDLQMLEEVSVPLGIGVSK